MGAEMIRVIKLLSVGLGLVFGQLLYQLLQTEPNWGTAWERAWFQIAAIVMYEILWGSNE